ncbi:MAG: nucleotidyltransferase domain-containing protein [Thaumarchaeota archaeon]|nr:nucleotidyltransferase domain-containing protein [Nitrososphaerota archaeon]
MSSFDSYVESGAEVLKHLKNYRKIAEKIKGIARRRCRNARVIVFGSVVENRVTALSDIDVLIICDLDKEERVKLKAEIRRQLGYDVPVELHIASEEEFRRWYRRFLDTFEEV